MLWSGTNFVSLATFLDPTLRSLKIAWFDLVGEPPPTTTTNPPQLKTTLNQSINQTSLVSPAPGVVPHFSLKGGIGFTKTTVPRSADSRRNLNAVGLWRVRWIKAMQWGATVWTIHATFFSFLPTNHTLGKSNLCCNFSSIVFLKSPSSAFTTFVLLRNQSCCGSMLVAAHEACAPVFLPGLICN